AWGAPRAAAADDDRRAWLLDGLGQRRRVDEPVVAALHREGLTLGGLPQADDRLELLLELLEAFAERWEGDAVRGVLLFVPPGAEPELHPASAHLVDLGDRDGEGPWEAERHRGDEGAEADRGGLAGEAGEGDPGVGGTRQPRHRPHLEVVVRPEERVVAVRLGGSRDREELVVAGALLGFGEDAEVHGPERTPGSPGLAGGRRLLRGRLAEPDDEDQRDGDDGPEDHR